MADSHALEFFIYTHDDREFTYFDGDRSRLEDIMAADNPEKIADELDEEGIDGLLVLDDDGGRWYLAFATSLGIVGQRTARRQADTIVRSGHTLADGYWLKAKYPMEELSDSNIGDLWQTVQQKYVKDGSLTGLELDEESGIPKQLAERAKEMEASGLKDDLSEAKLEKQEAQERAKAAAKSKGSSKGKKSTKKSSSKKKKEPKKTPKKETKKETTKKPEKKEKTESKPKKSATPKAAYAGPHFLEVKEIAEYVHDNFTRIVGKGPLTNEEGDSEKVNVIFDQSKISPQQWNGTVVFLEHDAILEITLEKTDEGLFATTVKA